MVDYLFKMMPDGTWSNDYYRWAWPDKTMVSWADYGKIWAISPEDWTYTPSSQFVNVNGELMAYCYYSLPWCPPDVLATATDIFILNQTEGTLRHHFKKSGSRSWDLYRSCLPICDFDCNRKDNVCYVTSAADPNYPSRLTLSLMGAFSGGAYEYRVPDTPVYGGVGWMDIRSYQFPYYWDEVERMTIDGTVYTFFARSEAGRTEDSIYPSSCRIRGYQSMQLNFPVILSHGEAP